MPPTNEFAEATVLVVDDDTTNLDMLTRRLERRGFRVVCARSAAEARDEMTVAMPDLILLDLMMPEISGSDFLEELRRQTQTSRIPVILVSALHDPETVVRSLNSGANDFVPKPINLDILLARMRTHLQLGAMIKRLEKQKEALEQLAAFDELTRIYNRRTGVAMLDAEIHRGARASRPLCVLMMDLDDFKKVNDTHGHPVGDVVLEEFARRIGESLRPSDIFFRYGGEEFTVVLPETGSHNASVIAERCLLRINGTPIAANDLRLNVTTSIGLVVGVPEAFSETDDWIRLADDALYKAKKEGKNRIVVSDQANESVGIGPTPPSGINL